MPDAPASSPPDLRRARLAIERSDVADLVGCLADRPDAASHPLEEKASRLLSDDRHHLAVALAPRFGAMVEEAHRLAAGAAARHSQVSLAEDFIAQESGAGEWGVDQTLCRLVLERLTYRPSSAAVVGTMRDDGIYILEWVAHYRALGFDHIFIYTNDNADGSDALLACLADAGVVTVIQNEVTGAVPPEVKAFGHAMNLLPALWQHEWALFVDSDEFWMPAPEMGRTVQGIVERLESADPGHRFGAVLYDWMWFVSEAKYKREAGTLIDRFHYSRVHWLGKCLVRLRDTSSMRRQHCPDLLEGSLLCNSAFEPIDLDTIWSRPKAEYSGGRVNHYWPKSFEEFAIKKARGAALGGENNPYDRPYRKFFEWNGSAENSQHCPPDKLLLAAMHREMRSLKALPGVDRALSDVEEGFIRRLASICSPQTLHALYEHNRVPAGPL